MHRQRKRIFADPRPADAPSPDRAADWVGGAVFHGHVALWSWPAEEAQRLLAPGLLLDPAPPEPPLAAGEHPVLFVHGEQTRGTNFFAGIPLRSGLAYHEAGFLVPFVRRAGTETLLTVVPRMYASFFPPVWHDAAYYGLGKELAAFHREGRLAVWTAENGRLLVELAAEPRGPWQPSAACTLPVLALIHRAVALPVVGRMRDGTLVGSHFSWDFRPAAVREADSFVQLHAGALVGVRSRACADVPHGTIEVRGMVWRLGWPGRCAV